MRVFWTEPAERQLRDIVASLSVSSTLYAERLGDRIVGRTEQLASFPKMGSVVEGYAPLEIRALIIEPYRVFCVLAGDRIDVLGVVHGARNLP